MNQLDRDPVLGPSCGKCSRCGGPVSINPPRPCHWCAMKKDPIEPIPYPKSTAPLRTQYSIENVSSAFLYEGLERYVTCDDINGWLSQLTTLALEKKSADDRFSGLVKGQLFESANQGMTSCSVPIQFGSAWKVDDLTTWPILLVFLIERIQAAGLGVSIEINHESQLNVGTLTMKWGKPQDFA